MTAATTTTTITTDDNNSPGTVQYWQPGFFRPTTVADFDEERHQPQDVAQDLSTTTSATSTDAARAETYSYSDTQLIEQEEEEEEQQQGEAENEADDEAEEEEEEESLFFRLPSSTTFGLTSTGSNTGPWRLPSPPYEGGASSSTATLSTDGVWLSCSKNASDTSADAAPVVSSAADSAHADGVTLPALKRSKAAGSRKRPTKKRKRQEREEEDGREEAEKTRPLGLEFCLDGTLKLEIWEDEARLSKQRYTRGDVKESSLTKGKRVRFTADALRQLIALIVDIRAVVRRRDTAVAEGKPPRTTWFTLLDEEGEVYAAVNYYKGKNLIHVRKYEGPAKTPTQQGVTLSAKALKELDDKTEIILKFLGGDSEE